MPLRPRALVATRSRAFCVSALRLHTSDHAKVLGANESLDIVIIGGGVVGLAMLAGLASNTNLPPMKVGIVDAMDLSRFRTWQDAKKAAAVCPTPTHDGVAWENRVISINMDNLEWMQQIGTLPYFDASRMRAVERIRVWDGLTDAAAEFNAEIGGEAALSTMVEISNLQQALLRHILDRAANPGSPLSVEMLDKTRVTNIHASGRDQFPVVSLENEQGTRHIATRLLVGADGHNSPVRAFAGIESFGWPYHCKGLVATVRTGSANSADPLVDASAWQRFLPTGTLAFLPLSPFAGTIVWALPPELADALGAMHRATAEQNASPSLLATLVSAGFRLPWSRLEPLLYGVVQRIEHGIQDWSAFESHVYEQVAAAELDAGAGAPTAHFGAIPPWASAVDAKSVASFPLQLKHAGCYLGATLNRNLHATLPSPSTLLTGALTALGLTPGGANRGCGQGRTVLVGDAAHTTHPLSGQGLNLGIQDVRVLTETIGDACMHGMDIGTHSALHPYEVKRYLPNQAMLSFTDHLHWLFATRPASEWTPYAPGIQTQLREAALKALVWARSTGLEMVNELNPLKRFFAQGAGSKIR
ncbi:Coq6p [Malassezia vespertilionis]|uniref:Coq6p n=2 Tax=Malassezia vespertilionis TaxID=2020962 RepID=A0A2N1JEH6_9BASI|nr:Coq6p [Malassezia vespertilionis]